MSGAVSIPKKTPHLGFPIIKLCLTARNHFSNINIVLLHKNSHLESLPRIESQLYPYLDEVALGLSCLLKLGGNHAFTCIAL